MLERKLRGDSAAPTHVPFLVLDENRFAFTAIHRLQKHPSGSASRLVFVHGPSGNGKTHLARQFVRDERRADPKVRLAHLTATEFAAEFAEASVAKQIHNFQQKYRALDVLVCEDIQTLERRIETQQQLVFAIDEILAAGGRCLITSTKSPGELINVLPRLVNRCRGGVTAPVIAPAETSRAKLVMHFAQTQQIPIPTEVGQTISAELPVSPRELLGTVLQIENWARVKKVKVDHRFVRRFLDGEVKPPSCTLTQIAWAVARHFDVRVKQLRDGSKAHGEVLPRQCAMYLARQLTNERLLAIAKFFGRKNHGTVLHACRRIVKVAETQPAVRQHLSQIRNTLSQASSGPRE